MQIFGDAGFSSSKFSYQIKMKVMLLTQLEVLGTATKLLGLTCSLHVELDFLPQHGEILWISFWQH